MVLGRRPSRAKVSRSVAVKAEPLLKVGVVRRALPWGVKLVAVS